MHLLHGRSSAKCYKYIISFHPENDTEIRIIIRVLHTGTVRLREAKEFGQVC